MEVTVQIPDRFIPAASEKSDISRELLEAYAIESYRREEMSLGQVAELLGLSIDGANTFLKEHNIPLNYTLEDIDDDQRTLELFLSK